MKPAGRIFLAIAALPAFVFAQVSDQARFAEIKARHDRGETVSREDREFARRYMAKRKGADANNAEWARTHPPRDSTGLIPLPDLGAGMYQGEQGGLYPGGKNVPPPSHLKAGLALAAGIVPLDAEGRPSADGKIVLLSVGMSNTTMEFSAFQRAAAATDGLNPALTIVDGAQGGQTARVTANPEANYWKVAEQRLAKAGATPRQVQVAWIKQANARPGEGFPQAARMLAEDLTGTLHTLHDKYPNLKIAYLSSRIYGGYATSPLNPEPYAYEGAFAVKWTVADQIAGKPGLNYDPARGAVRAPWIAWGPYLWADGVKGRRQDGFTWIQDDFVASDRTHPADSARKKVAKLLLDFFKSDPAARPWFMGR